ncbi:hypothetical protein PLANTIT3_20037 [Plantibacter sp. T3]|nr:hypothetical protein PLANTIT3_20037 [Plantibacter sp. T3]
MCCAKRPSKVLSSDAGSIVPHHNSTRALALDCDVNAQWL